MNLYYNRMTINKKEYMRNYMHKYKLKGKIHCELCNKDITILNFSRHKKTMKHLKLLNNNSEQTKEYKKKIQQRKDQIQILKNRIKEIRKENYKCV
ncbi:MAG: hypothetical protein H6630_08890 [Arcobacter sp.]|nr:hypothetical protein [Arcobacter sp.]